MSASARQFSCSSCAGTLEFEPAEQKLVCRFCGEKRGISSPKDKTIFKSSERCYDTDRFVISPEDPPEEHRIIQCGGCAAKLEFETDDRATKCPYCGTPLVQNAKAEEFLPLQGVVPFQISRGDLAQHVQRWVSSRWFLPSGLSKLARRTREITGIYVPYWTFDAATRTEYSGQRGTTYTVPRTTTINGKTKTIMETKVNWTPRHGQVSQHFDDVLVCGSANFPAKLVDAFGTWSIAPMRHYQDDYLAGFEAERHSISLPEGFEDAKEKMEVFIRRSVKHDIGGDRQRIDWMNTRYANVRYRQVLMPIWSTTFRHNGKNYSVLVNGQTGEVSGERPYSIWKIAAAVLGVLAIGGIVFAVSVYSGGFNLQEFRFE